MQKIVKKVQNIKTANYLLKKKPNSRERKQYLFLRNFTPHKSMKLHGSRRETNKIKGTRDQSVLKIIKILNIPSRRVY